MIDNVSKLPTSRRLVEARRIKGRALDLLKSHGSTEEVGGLSLTILRGAAFQTWIAPNLPSPGLTTLDIRDQRQGRKVFSVTWDSDANDRIVTFRRGPWENDFLAQGGQPL